MPADTLGKQQVRTDANDDVKVQVADATTPSQLLNVDASGRVSSKLFSGGGASIGAAADALKIDIASQGLAALKVSRDGGAPTAANAGYAEIVTGTGPAIVSESNPLAVQVVNDPTPGTVKRGEDAGAYDKAAAVAGNGGQDPHDYTVTTGMTLTLHEVTVSAPGAARFDVILHFGDGAAETTIDTFYIPASGGSYTKTYAKNPPTVAAEKVLRIQRTNNEKAVASALDLVSSWMGSEA